MLRYNRIKDNCFAGEKLLRTAQTKGQPQLSPSKFTGGSVWFMRICHSGLWKWAQYWIRPDPGTCEAPGPTKLWGTKCCFGAASHIPHPLVHRQSQGLTKCSLAHSSKTRGTLQKPRMLLHLCISTSPNRSSELYSGGDSLCQIKK